MADTSKCYLTKEGLKRTKKEYSKLLEMRKLKSQGEIPSVLHSEELSAEFIAFRDDLDFLEARIGELEHVLKNFELIKVPPRKERDRVNLGAHVTVEINGQKDEVIIVGTLASNLTQGKISNEYPVGKNLLGRKSGEKVAIGSPKEVIYKIKKIKY